MTPGLNTDIIHAVLEAIDYLVFLIVNKPQLLVNTIYILEHVSYFK